MPSLKKSLIVEQFQGNYLKKSVQLRFQDRQKTFLSDQLEDLVFRSLNAL